MRTKQHCTYKYKSKKIPNGGNSQKERGQFVELKKKGNPKSISSSSRRRPPSLDPVGFFSSPISCSRSTPPSPELLLLLLLLSQPTTQTPPPEPAVPIFPSFQRHPPLLNSNVSTSTLPRQPLHLHLPQRTSSPPPVARHRYPTKTFPLHTTDLPVFSLQQRPQTQQPPAAA